jgi:PAS domain S-box-containing protein
MGLNPTLLTVQFASILLGFGGALLACVLFVLIRRQQTRLRVSESEVRLAALVSSAGDAILMTDEQLRLVDVNGAAERLFGFPRAAAIGRPLEEFVAIEDRGRFRQTLAAFLRSDETSAMLSDDNELRALRHDGSTFTFEASTSKLRANATMSLALVVRDVTVRREAE